MSIPKRWVPYRSVGDVIEGTRFFAFKVPLKEASCFRLPFEQRFTPSCLVGIVNDRRKKLGMVIDLTFTYKYYNPKELEQFGVKYVKIKTEGQQIPRDGVYQKFSDAISTYLRENADSDTLIGIHCTHGLNRTGYLICRYMIESMSYNPDVAIAAFNKARGHDIEREAYIADLQSRGNRYKIEKKRDVAIAACNRAIDHSMERPNYIADSQSRAKTENSLKGNMKSQPYEHASPDQYRHQHRGRLSQPSEDTALNSFQTSWQRDESQSCRWEESSFQNQQRFERNSYHNRPHGYANQTRGYYNGVSGGPSHSRYSSGSNYSRNPNYVPQNCHRFSDNESSSWNTNASQYSHHQKDFNQNNRDISFSRHPNRSSNNVSDHVVHVNHNSQYTWKNEHSKNKSDLKRKSTEEYFNGKKRKIPHE